MGEAKSGDTVQVHYTGKLDDGTVFDTSEGRDPLEFQLGSGAVIPGFEEAVIGLEEGQNKTTRILAEQAYGKRLDENVIAVPRDQFPPELELALGQQLQVRQPNGDSFVVLVKDVSEAEVLLDGNHPLAGEDLTFDIHLVKIL